MVPDSDHAWRIGELERDAAAAMELARRAQEAAVVQAVQLLAAQDDVRELRAEVKEARAGVRTLILVLVGFAFTVAGSAVALALSLGGSP